MPRKFSFARLQTKLTVLYAALFGLTLLVISTTIYVAIAAAALNQVESELAATGTVFDRVWSLRSGQLRQGVGLLSRDFGFRAAVATGDEDTILSAMENLRGRLAIDRAFILGVDGRMVAMDAAGMQADAPALLSAFYDSEEPVGVTTLAGQPYEVVAAPIYSPDLKGWVVFAARLDAREMTGLEKLSAIPLSAQVLHRQGGAWAGGEAPEQKRLAAFVDKALAAGVMKPQTLKGAQGASLALVKPLPMLTPSSRAVLVIRYPLALAMAPYQLMLITIALAAVIGLAVVVWGSWVLARSLTRPISALDQAAHLIQRGEDAHVEIDTQDEIGRLADSFNQMALDIRDRERRITHLAMHDNETGLPNRLALERVGAILTEEVSGTLFVVALGIDRFSHVRSAIGHELAAQAMGMIGSRLADVLSRAQVGRLSTDVLGCLIEAPDAEAAKAGLLELLAGLEEPVHVGGEAIDILLTAGFAPADAAIGLAIERADIALEQARSARSKIALFDAEAYGDPSSKLSLMSGMLRGLENGEIELFYQPKYDVRDRAVTGVEALVRWRRPERGMLPPDQFIPLAEETGHVRALTDWVLRRAIADQKTMAEAGHDLSMSINISGRLLGDRDFARFAIEEVADAVGEICFEITETAVIENPPLALELLDAFAEAGIGISIDDYGTGLSSLAYLKRIRGQELKIDKSIVEGVAESSRDALIVRSTIDLAHSLGLKVTAEGVETGTVYALLAAMGCDSIQGYLIERPRPLNELLEFLTTEASEGRAYG